VSENVSIDVGADTQLETLLFDPTNTNGENLVVEGKAANSNILGVVTIFWNGIGKHTHDVSINDSSTTSNGGGTSSTTSSETSLQSGIVSTANEVSNVAVDIDGTTVVSGLSSPIQETVDITGELTSGANTITTTTDTLGEVRTSITYETLKNASR
jgi:hypothetical protein